MPKTGLELLDKAHRNLLTAYETMLDTDERYEVEHSEAITKIDKVIDLILYLEVRTYRAQS
jgi:hypothetical protein